MNINKTITAVALPVLAIGSFLSAANKNGDKCATVNPPVPCNQEQCKFCYCLGPENYGVNAPVCPKTCNGDYLVNIAGFYWNSHMDGLEFGVTTNVQNPGTDPSVASIEQLNNIIDAKYLTPQFNWEFGFKLGVGYCSSCDGWDFGINWTWYRGSANGKDEAEVDDNQTIVAIWSAFNNVNGSVTYATEISHYWKLRLNLIDLELGRNFWTSKYVALRPFIGLRVAYINQSLTLNHKGGSWSAVPASASRQQAYNNEVNLSNNFHGVGVRTGLNSEWNLGCGWGIYGNGAVSIVYGRFKVKHDEDNRLAQANATKTEILDTEYSFRASRAILDLALGVQWSTMFCECKYGFTGMIGWEHHLFFDQNQLWRVVRIGGTQATVTNGLPNNNGENVFSQRRGDLDTQGWTLTLKFEF